MLGGYNFKFRKSEIPVERYAFGDFDGTGAGEVGSLLLLFQPGARLVKDLLALNHGTSVNIGDLHKRAWCKSELPGSGVSQPR